MSYYVLNTNMKEKACFTKEMLSNRKAAAYSGHWRKKIDRLHIEDIVFLYKNREGIIAYGTVAGERKKNDRDGKEGEEYYVPLKPFIKLTEPMSAAKMRDLSDKCPAFRHTLYLISQKTGECFIKEILENHGPIKEGAEKTGSGLPV